MINIIGTSSTPEIFFDPHKGELSIKGKAIPEDPKVIFSDVIDAIREYAESPSPQTVVDFDFEYINTSSVKWIFQILELFEKMHINKHPVLIRFWYSDESILETGNYLKTNIAVPMLIIQK